MTQEEELDRLRGLYLDMVRQVRNNLPADPQTDLPDESMVFGHAGRIWDTFNQTNVKFEL